MLSPRFFHARYVFLNLPSFLAQNQGIRRKGERGNRVGILDFLASIQFQFFILELSETRVRSGANGRWPV